MMSEFALYLQLGFRHIADLAGYDHILFIAALAIPYALGNWRALAVLITAFTLGHSITLALATLQLVHVPSALVETLIPITIVITAALALFEMRGHTGSSAPTLTTTPVSRYVIAAAFGLIHGLGFSTYLRSLLGQEESIALPLLAFNVGLELGQLLILSVVLTIGTLVVRAGVARRFWMQLLAVFTGGLALVLLVERLGLVG